MKRGGSGCSAAGYGQAVWGTGPQQLSQLNRSSHLSPNTNVKSCTGGGLFSLSPATVAGNGVTVLPVQQVSRSTFVPVTNPASHAIKNVTTTSGKGGFFLGGNSHVVVGEEGLEGGLPEALVPLSLIALDNYAHSKKKSRELVKGGEEFKGGLPLSEVVVPVGLIALNQYAHNRRRSNKKNKRGGAVGALIPSIQNIAVPAVLIAANQLYGNRRRSQKKLIGGLGSTGPLSGAAGGTSSGDLLNGSGLTGSGLTGLSNITDVIKTAGLTAQDGVNNSMLKAQDLLSGMSAKPTTTPSLQMGADTSFTKYGGKSKRTTAKKHKKTSGKK